jgi:hypothetical protein
LGDLNETERRAKRMDKFGEYLEEVRKLRSGMEDDIPVFDDEDDRTDARVLFLFQDPGKSGAAKSWRVSRANEDPSALTFKKLNEDMGLNPKLTVSWNTIPWTMRDTFPQELARVREWDLIPKLLDALPKVVVLCGTSKAHRVTVEVYAYADEKGRDLMVLHAPHPSNRGLAARDGFTRAQRTGWLRKVIEQAREHIEHHSPNVR